MKCEKDGGVVMNGESDTGVHLGRRARCGANVDEQKNNIKRPVFETHMPEGVGVLPGIGLRFTSLVGTGGRQTECRRNEGIGTCANMGRDGIVAQRMAGRESKLLGTCREVSHKLQQL